MEPSPTVPPPQALAVTVLGSGGPFLTPTRTSSGYLVWLEGQPRLLVDPGGGSFQRLGQLGIAVEDLDAVLLTHLHIDHCCDLAPVAFAMWMAGRNRPLPVLGPAPGQGQDQGQDQDEDQGQPGCREFCDLLFGPGGAWRYLNTFEDFALEVSESPSDPAGARVSTALELPGLTISTVAVPHGMMPSVAYRISSSNGASICFSGDVESDHDGLTQLARDVDLLIHDMALPERDVPHGHLHAKPSQVGTQAARSRARALLLTHVMPDLEDERAAAEVQIRTAYAGPMQWATDVTTYPAPATLASPR